MKAKATIKLISHQFALWRFLLPIVFLAFSISPSRAQTYLLKASLYEVDSFSRIPFAVISLKGKMTAVTSDESGYFEINCLKTDTLQIRHISFDVAYVPVRKILDSTSKIPRIYLRKKQVNLIQVTISGNRLSQEKKEEYQRHLDRVKPTISSPISAIYESLSRRGKERSKMDEIYSALLLRDKLEVRIPPSKLFLITNDRSIKLDDLLGLCPVNNYFVTNTSDYVFFLHFTRCWEEYKKRH